MSSSIISQIETATSENLTSEDWALILNVCDTIDKDPNGPKTCASALQRRILHSNPKVTNFALTLLDAIFKNCNKNTILAFTDATFLDTLRSKLNLDTPVYLKPRINELLQTAAKFTPTPTLETVLANKSKVNELITLLHSIPPYTSPTDHPTIQSIYQELLSLRPTLIQFMTHYTQQKNNLIHLNDQLQHARAKYNVLMEQAIRTPSSYELYHPPPPPAPSTYYLPINPPNASNPPGRG